MPQQLDHIVRTAGSIRLQGLGQGCANAPAGLGCAGLGLGRQSGQDRRRPPLPRRHGQTSRRRQT